MAARRGQFTQTNEVKLRGLEMWMYRRIGQVSWKAKKTNKELLNKLGLQSSNVGDSLVWHRPSKVLWACEKTCQSATYNH